MKFDFSGWATKNDLRCSDGRVIRHGAFSENDGQTVPLVWQHMHDSPNNILGHAQLENRDEGVYAYCTFNDSPYGQQAKEIVKHGDVCSLSIYANQLQQRGSEVMHGIIREVSLVLTGANPGAYIDNLSFQHSDGYVESVDDEAVIYNGEDIELYHAGEEGDEEGDEKGDEAPEGDDDETIEDVFNTLSDKQKDAVYAIIGMALENKDGEAAQSGMNGEYLSHADEKGDEAPEGDDDETIEDVFNTLSDKQKDAVYAIIGMAVEGQDNNQNADGEAAHSYQEDDVMKRNVFDGSAVNQGETLSHAEMNEIFADAKRTGSLKDAVLEHGITNIDVFFPDAQTVGDYPAMISRPMEWVSGILAGVHKTPFSKVKSVAANLTGEEARARGYIKGDKKIEEQIAALKRETGPQTIYKVQKLDRDDIIDITDFDVVAFLKSEMRVMLDEEVARAVLIGDGRAITDRSKIKEDNIRPIWTDHDMYTVHTVIDKTLTGQAKAEAFIDAAIRTRKYYMGSGSPTLYIGTDLLTEMRLIRDQMGHRLYKNDQELADELRVSKIVEIQLLDGKTRTVDGDVRELGGLIVNLNDYNCGATKGGEVNMFDDFDIDYNKYEYLIETRMSGALYVPYSAMALEFGTTASTTGHTPTANGAIPTFEVTTVTGDVDTGDDTGDNDGTNG